MSPAPAVAASALRKRYGTTDALDGLNLVVPPGTVHGILGPNGAGKTTAVRVLSTLVRADSGTARVAGFDVATQATLVRRSIGLVGQNAAVDEILTGRQNLVLFGRLHHLRSAAATRRAGELLDAFGLTEAADKPVKQYSGGMRRRLDLAAGLLTAPSVLFLDEPTTGLDPRARTEMWESVRELAASGTTVILTTQYLDEADHLADAVSVVDGGRVIAQGTPDELKGRLGGDRLDVTVRDAADLVPAAELLQRVTGGDVHTDADRRRASAPVTDRVTALGTVLRAVEGEHFGVEDVTIRRPTLDEVFLHLTGSDASQPAKETTA
ncbi:daunorubicin/doxorubicin resistance ABC transporter ATP-binding protein DrrA [Saccharomonospora piscinae]|uniref:Daunorubicin/doxorubicin resistance ABC transporter ATP-binding protein DrrA n=1 Tax=Saccharomonospora piscinae TaxID=687388 RepID=A0A1V9A697_SACPI|nr:ATP-binding cassette domain-containing protein [Saccharomonospora piscinae]OQO92464.1 daunorubicin/doxorubicin resistance ABC transporter ATP-binding protein DrrA [Saccharomonospora piscinae]TLW91830.1 ATP-binding cassette domain-containing protein [Saccharomonospora piscinae]